MPSELLSVIARSAALGWGAGARNSLVFAMPVLTAPRPHPAAGIAAGVVLAGELIGDKLPQTPSRLRFPGPLLRILSGAAGGVVIARRISARSVAPRSDGVSPLEGLGQVPFDPRTADRQGQGSDRRTAETAIPAPPTSSALVGAPRALVKRAGAGVRAIGDGVPVPVLVAGVVAGALGGAASVCGGAWWRSLSVDRRPDWPGAIVEDVIAVGAAYWACRVPPETEPLER